MKGIIGNTEKLDYNLLRIKTQNVVFIYFFCREQLNLPGAAEGPSSLCKTVLSMPLDCDDSA